MSLRETRISRGMRLHEFAGLIPVSPATASRWETGKRRPHSADLDRIARALNLDAALVTGWFSEQPPLHTESFAGAANLRVLREQRGLSRADLGRSLEVSPATVAHWECGRRSLPVTRLLPLARTFGLPAHDLAAVLRASPQVRRRRVPPLTMLRYRAGLTQAQVAGRLAVSTGTVSAWERSVRSPTWPQLRALHDVYQCGLADVATAAGAELWPAAGDREPGHRLATVIATGRRWRGTSLRDTAAGLSVNWQTLRRWERGETLPHRRYLSPLEDVLGLYAGALTLLASDRTPSIARALTQT